MRYLQVFLSLLALFPVAVFAGEAPEQGTVTFTAEPAARIVTVTGFTRPRNRLDLISEEPGKVIRVYVDVGDTMGEKGVFARLDRTFLKLDLDKNLADQKRLQSETDFYAKEVARYKELVSLDTASQSALDNVQVNLDRAIQQLQALKVQEKVLRERLYRSVIRAPKGWQVVSRHIEEGQWISKGRKVGEAARFDKLLLPLAVTVTELQAIQKQEPLEISFPDIQASALARIERVSPDFDPQTRKINVDLEINNMSRSLRGGLRSELSLHLPDPAGSVLVPKDSLLQAYEEYYLFRPDGEKIRVSYLGAGPNGRVRVSSLEIEPGQEFLLNPEKDE